MPNRIKRLSSEPNGIRTVLVEVSGYTNKELADQLRDLASDIECFDPDKPVEAKVMVLHNPLTYEEAKAIHDGLIRLTVPASKFF